MEEWYQSNKVSFQRNRDCMVNYRNVSYALGVLVLVEAGFFALCAGVSFYYQEEDYIHFLETLLINVVLGGLLLLGGKRNEVSINRRDGYCIVSLSWILFSALGMLPVVAGEVDPNEVRGRDERGGSCRIGAVCQRRSRNEGYREEVITQCNFKGNNEKEFKYHHIGSCSALPEQLQDTLRKV